VRGIVVNMSGTEITHRAIRVWQRNARVWLQFYKPSLVGNLGEPILFLLAIGYGLGKFVPDVGGISYIQFLAPGLVVSSGMYTATFECSFGSFTRMVHQKTYDAIIASPVNIEEVVTGDILWGATKSIIGGTIIMMVITAFGLVPNSWSWLAMPGVLVVEGLMFSSIAMVVTSVARSYDFFNYYFTLFITPMFLFSGIFFPLEAMPPWVVAASWCFPLTHVVAVARSMVLGAWNLKLAEDLLWIIVVTSVFYLAAVLLIKRRMIK